MLSIAVTAIPTLVEIVVAMNFAMPEGSSNAGWRTGTAFAIRSSAAGWA
ncbi:MAG: hypothetical protein KF800_13095 [Lysobacter sp.]|nr:hypothetical protein [Lysobacter sp.]